MDKQPVNEAILEKLCLKLYTLQVVEIIFPVLMYFFLTHLRHFIIIISVQLNVDKVIPRLRVSVNYSIISV